MSASRTMHLGLLMTGAGSHVAGWRLPEAEFGAENLDLIIRMAQSAERGCLDFVFFADAVDTSPDAHPGMLVRLEPLTLLAALAVVTDRIGLAATVSTTYSEPYNVARMLASIDHISNGRAGWNVVTGSSPAAASNFGHAPHPPHAERYARAQEFLGVVKGLWDSWAEGAIVADKERGRFADPDGLRVLNHEGQFFRVKGPLNITRPPQGHPVIMQAGASDTGRDFAAATAEVVFTTQQDLGEAIAFAQDLRDRCVAAGRPRDAVKILPGVTVVVGDSEQDARNQIAALAGLIDPVASLKVLSDRIGHDLARFDLDGPVPDLGRSAMMQGHATVLMSVARRHNLSIRELRDFTAAGTGHRVVHGTPESIADDLQSWFEAGAADGFIVKTCSVPGPLDAFVDRVVPELRRRGLFRLSYEGQTLRDHLGLARPSRAG